MIRDTFLQKIIHNTYKFGWIWFIVLACLGKINTLLKCVRWLVKCIFYPPIIENIFCNKISKELSNYEKFAGLTAFEDSDAWKYIYIFFYAWKEFIKSNLCAKPFMHSSKNIKTISLSFKSPSRKCIWFPLML